MHTGLQCIGRWVVALFLLQLPLLAQGHFYRTITFDGYPIIPPGDNIGVNYYYEDSMTFTPMVPGGQFSREGGGRPAFPDNGTAYLIFGLGDTLSGTRAVGGYAPHFGLHAVDLAEFSTHYPYPTTVQFTGYLADGSSVTTQFTTDGLIDGPGGLADFQTFYFDDRFSDIVRFDAPNMGYAMDNLVFYDVIPEPAASHLLLLAAVATGLTRLKRS